jgi:hypothetical protein
VVWDRVSSTPGEGEPLFAATHPIRQRCAMQNLLCQVCGEKAKKNRRGIRWVLPSSVEEIRSMGSRPVVSEPPTCEPCFGAARFQCPVLRERRVCSRVERSLVVGVAGDLYVGVGSTVALAAPGVVVPFSDRRSCKWVVASEIVRELIDWEFDFPA